MHSRSIPTQSSNRFPMSKSKKSLPSAKQGISRSKSPNLKGLKKSGLSKPKSSTIKSPKRRLPGKVVGSKSRLKTPVTQRKRPDTSKGLKMYTTEMK